MTKHLLKDDTQVNVTTWYVKLTFDRGRIPGTLRAPRPMSSLYLFDFLTSCME